MSIRFHAAIGVGLASLLLVPGAIAAPLSLAVLPIEHTPGGDSDYLAAALREALVAELKTTDTVRLVDRGVATHAVMSSLQVARGTGLVVFARLVLVSTGEVLGVARQTAPATTLAPVAHALIVDLLEPLRRSAALTESKALEKRLAEYDGTGDLFQRKANEDARKAIAAERDPARRAARYQTLMMALMTQRRWHELAATARAILEGPDTPPGYPGQPSIKELAAMELVYADEVYRDLEGVLRDGERFLAAWPTSIYTFAVRMKVQAALDSIAQTRENAATAARELGKLTPEQRADPCRTVVLYASYGQWADARKLLDNMKPAQCPPAAQELQWFLVGMNTGDFARAREALARLRTTAPELARSSAVMELSWPVD